jgi:hypothetical protein
MITEGDEPVPAIAVGAAGGGRRWHTLLVLLLLLPLPLPFVPGAETPPPAGAIDGRSGGTASVVFGDDGVQVEMRCGGTGRWR